MGSLYDRSRHRGWIELVEVDDKKADNIANLVELHWLNRFPHPQELVLDRGTEFMGEVISLLRDEYNIIRKPITTRNPQANAIVERVHKTLNEIWSVPKASKILVI